MRTDAVLWWSSRIFLLIISALGFLVAFYLTLVHYRGGIPRCYVVEGCAIVQTSRYSSVWGIPIALPGMLHFAVMFYLVIALLVVRNARAVLAFKILALAGAVAAIPLFLLQAIALRAYCTFCLATDFFLVACWLASLTLHSSRAAKGDCTRPASSSGHSEGEAGS